MEILINGVSLAELKKQQQAIKKDASKFISDNIDKVQQLVDTIVNSDDVDHEVLAKEALEILENVQLVSNVSGVEYNIPYNSEWDRDSDTMSTKISEAETEDGERKFDYYGSGWIADLYGALEDMEYTVEKWNRSYC